MAAFFSAMMWGSVVYAGGGEDEVTTTKKPKVKVQPTVEPTQKPLTTETPKPTIGITEGTPFSDEGNVSTRDLLYDATTNKQFITIQTRSGAVYYLVIDYDKPLDEKGEKYETYFLNVVDERDLEELLSEEAQSTPIVCICTEKCELGAVNEECPLCSKDIKKCVGKESATAEPTPTETAAPEQTTKAETKQSTAMYVVIVLLLLLAGGGTFVYLKFGKNTKKAKVPNSLDDYEFEEEDDDEVYEKDEEEDSNASVEDEDE